MRYLIILAGLGILGTLTYDQHPWQAWVYPMAEDGTLSSSLAGFETFEDCRTAAIEALRASPGRDKGTYVCGRACRWERGTQSNRCAELRREPRFPARED